MLRSGTVSVSASTLSLDCSLTAVCDADNRVSYFEIPVGVRTSVPFDRKGSRKLALDFPLSCRLDCDSWLMGRYRREVTASLAQGSELPVAGQTKE